MKIDKIGNLVGNTPMIKIKIKFDNEIKNIYAKLEYYNLTGSIKDRVAYAILKEAISSGKLSPHTPIIEATSGNTGISLACMCLMLSLKCIIVMSKNVSEERKTEIIAWYHKALDLDANAIDNYPQELEKYLW